MINMTVKIGGEAGFGIMTTGIFLGKIATRSGYFAFEYSEYPSLIRGGHNVVEVRICDEPVYSQEKKVDVLMCLNKETFLLHKNELKDGAVVVYDQDKIDINAEKIIDKNITYVHLPFAQILAEGKFPTVMINNIALGALMHLLGADFEVLKGMITETFIKKGQEVIDKNVSIAQMGRDAALKCCPSGCQYKMPKKDTIETKMYATGNEMLGLATIAAQCKLFVAYPMTPASALLHYLAGKAEKSGMVVKHAEDEISVINMALGGSFAGVRSMVSTSGGGFALMVEAVSLAGITETPIVIGMGSRPGPATGMPTWTEQGDLLFILHSGHGEFPKILLAPGDIEETYKLTIEAFNYADIYQTPVFVITDKYLLEGHQSVNKNKITDYKVEINRGKLLKQEEFDALSEYKRYADSPDGISARAIPGTSGAVFQANSYEHRQDGHTSEEASDRILQAEKRNRKITTFLSTHAKLPVLYGNKDAKHTVVVWGSMKGPSLEAMKGNESLFNVLHFSFMWPLPQKEVKELLLSLKSPVLVENNMTGQLGQLLKMVTGFSFEKQFFKYDGRPIYPEEILEFVLKI
jgi:2-oxoglutarate/2-oxoacid ferredoxin oxidoreductase subunit alpha